MRLSLFQDCSQCSVYAKCCVLLQAGYGVRLDIHRDCHRGMAGAFAGNHWMDSLPQEIRGVRVPETVEYPGISGLRQILVSGSPSTMRLQISLATWIEYLLGRPGLFSSFLDMLSTPKRNDYLKLLIDRQRISYNGAEHKAH